MITKQVKAGQAFEWSLEGDVEPKSVFGFRRAELVRMEEYGEGLDRLDRNEDNLDEKTIAKTRLELRLQLILDHTDYLVDGDDKYTIAEHKDALCRILTDHLEETQIGESIGVIRLGPVGMKRFQEKLQERIEQARKNG